MTLEKRMSRQILLHLELELSQSTDAHTVHFNASVLSEERDVVTGDDTGINAVGLIWPNEMITSRNLEDERETSYHSDHLKRTGSNLQNPETRLFMKKLVR